MPMLKLLNGDLISIPIMCMQKLRAELTEQLHLEERDHIKLIDTETEEVLDEDVDIVSDKLYLVMIEKLFIRKWIDLDKLDWKVLSGKEYAMPFLLAHPEYILWDYLCLNPHPDAIQMIEEKMGNGMEPCWKFLSQNPSALHLLEKHPEKISWECAVYNPNPQIIPLMIESLGVEGSIALIKENNIACFADPSTEPYIEQFLPHLRQQCSVLNNPSPRVYEMIKTVIHWSRLYAEIGEKTNPFLIKDAAKDIAKGKIGIFQQFHFSPASIPYLKQYPKRIIWRHLAMHKSAEAIEMVKQRLKDRPKEYVSWSDLSRNPYAISLLEENMDKIDWDCLLTNPNAIHLIEKRKETLTGYGQYMLLSDNQGIFYDYPFKKE